MGISVNSERLEILSLTTLAERRIPGELIETFKAVNELSSLDTNFDISGSGLNLVARSVNNGTAKVKS